MKFKRVCGLLICLLATFGAAALEVKIEAPNVSITKTLETTVPVKRLRALDSPDGSRFWLRRLAKDGPVALETLGYYSATLTSEIDSGQVVITVMPGVPVRVTELLVDPGTDRQFSAFPLAIGDPLDHAAYERGKQSIHAELLSAGYLEAQLIENTVEVNRTEQSASITLRWLAGKRFRFGEFQFSGSPLNDRFMTRYRPSGDEFITELRLQELRSNLSKSPYFSSVAMLPQLNAITDDRVPIQVELQAAKRTISEIGLSIGTNLGPGLQLDVKRNWLNSNGHRWLGKIETTTQRSLFASRYEIPSARTTDRSIQLDLNHVDEQTDSSDRRSWKLGVNKYRLWHGWRLTTSLSALDEDFTVAGLAQESSLLFPGVELSRRKADDPVNPANGWRARFSLSAAGDSLGSDTSFVRAEAQFKAVHSFSQSGRMLFRGRLGAMTTDEFERLPSSLRFYAGGDNSVRGFDYEALGPRRDGEVLGGEYVGEASIEFDYLFKPRWRWALFADSGNAFGDGQEKLEYSAGLGLRWLSPIGPLRLDIASAISEPGNPIRIHFYAGPDL